MKPTFPRSLLAVMLASTFAASGVAFAANALTNAGDKVVNTLDSAAHSTGRYLDDSAVTTKVKAALLADEQVKSLPISVETHKGVVQLSGFVSDQRQAWRASEVAAGTEGVRAVKNDLRLKGGASNSATGYLSDAAITSKVKAALLEDKQVKSGSISVKTDDGVVQLSGFVKSKGQSERAQQVAAGVKDVKRVQNDLRLQ